MIVDVDYLLPTHNELIKSHVIIANKLSLVDRAARSTTYCGATLETQMQRGEYSIKNADESSYTHSVLAYHTQPRIKR